MSEDSQEEELESDQNEFSAQEISIQTSFKDFEIDEKNGTNDASNLVSEDSQDDPNFTPDVSQEATTEPRRSARRQIAEIAAKPKSKIRKTPMRKQVQFSSDSEDE